MSSEAGRSRVVDYDEGDYDYRRYWADRDYEQRGEDAVLRRLTPQLDGSDWIADLGGGYGRNLPYYRPRCRHAVLVDYSTTNLTNAARAQADDVAAGRLYVVRADLNALPFRDAAFDAALSIRVLHHLPDVDRALTEMLRTVGSRAILDVPIKHHVLARAQALAHRRSAQLKSDTPNTWGKTDFPFTQFRLEAVLRTLSGLGFDADVAASVNNFRRWDRALPRPAVKALGPLMHGLELTMQRAGRGWWGPNQFVVASRRLPARFAAPAGEPVISGDLAPADAALARRCRCPGCAGDLAWSSDHAHCATCARVYPHRDGYWDLTQDGSEPAG